MSSHWRKVESFCEKINTVLKDYISILFTPAFAVMNYFQLKKHLDQDSWLTLPFFFLSVVYTLATLLLGCLAIYKNAKK